MAAYQSERLGAVVGLGMGGAAATGFGVFFGLAAVGTGGLALVLAAGFAVLVD